MLALSSRKVASLLVVVLAFVAVKATMMRNPLSRALDPTTGYLLAPLLTPRVAGTEGGARARQHIARHLDKAGWSVNLHNFTATTPLGPRSMSNIVAKRKSFTSKPRITLAAHYDSKAEPKGFIGATDSAFPCALLLWLASISNKVPRYDFDLIFFDGEEAFVSWNDEDSLYGARALAEHQAQENQLPSTLVLLDLLGNEARFPIPSWFAETEHLHRQLSKINPRLVGGRNLHQYAGMMQDDHIPYLARNVPVLHLIPPRFPDEWHTLDDNADVLDWDTMAAWADLFEKWLYQHPNA